MRLSARMGATAHWKVRFSEPQQPDLNRRVRGDIEGKFPAISAPTCSSSGSNGVFMPGSEIETKARQQVVGIHVEFENGSVFSLGHHSFHETIIFNAMAVASHHLLFITQRKPTWLLAVRTSPLPRVPTI